MTIISKPDRTSKLLAATDSYREQVALPLYDANEVTTTAQDGHLMIDALDESRHLVIRVHNNTGGTLSKNKLINESGWDVTSKALTVQLADNTAPDNALGFLLRDLADGETGHAALVGSMDGVVTTGATVGDPVYLGTSGDITLVEPTNKQQVGIVTNADAVDGQVIIDIGLFSVDTLSQEQINKLDDTVYVTDTRFAGGADPTGVSDSQPAIQAAIDYAITNRIGRVFFPRGHYIINSTVNTRWLETDNAYQLILDFGGSRIETTLDITMFARTPNHNEVNGLLIRWPVTFVNGWFVQGGTQHTGTAIEIRQQMNLLIDNCFFTALDRAVDMLFCLHHTVINCQAYGCKSPFRARSMVNDGGGSPFNSNSNQGTWISTRANTDHPAGIAFAFHNCTGITMLSCTSEGDAVDVPLLLDGAEDDVNIVDDRKFHIVNHYFEYDQTAGVITSGTFLQIKDMQRGMIYFSPNIPQKHALQTPRLVSLTGNTSVRTNRTVIHIDSTSYFDSHYDTPVWFDGDVQVDDDRQNYWVVTNCPLSADDTITDPSRWVGGAVPRDPNEDNFDRTRGKARNSRLTIPADSLLANTDATTEQIVKPITSGTLPAGDPDAAGAVVLGWDGAGNLAEFTVQARKDGIDDLGTLSGSGSTINFDTGSYDNKEAIFAANQTLTLSSTRDGKYRLRARQDSQGGRVVTLLSTTLSPVAFTLPLNPAPDSLTVFDFEYDLTSDTWNW